MPSWKKDYARYKSFFLNIWVYYNTKPNVKIYLELMLSMGTIILFSLFAIRPTVLTIIDIYEQIKSKEAISTKLEQKIKNLQSANRTMQSNAESLIAIDESVPSAPQLETVIIQIEKIATEASVNLNSLTSSDVNVKGSKQSKNNNELSPLPNSADGLLISVSVSGDYLNILNFISNIENMRRPFKIDNIILNAVKQDNEIERLVNLTFTARLPFLLNNEK